DLPRYSAELFGTDGDIPIRCELRDAPEAPPSLQNQTFEFRYENGAVYRVEFHHDPYSLGGGTLTWTALAGPETGRSETDVYFVKAISPTTYEIAWKENDGTKVFVTLNLAKWTIATRITLPDGEILEQYGQAILTE